MEIWVSKDGRNWTNKTRLVDNASYPTLFYDGTRLLLGIRGYGGAALCQSLDGGTAWTCALVDSREVGGRVAQRNRCGTPAGHVSVTMPASKKPNGDKGMITTGLFSSASGEWSTPRTLFDVLNAEFGFTLDVCATPENTQCAAFYTKAENGLTQQWKGTIWCNPPYGREIGNWIRKAFETSRDGATVVLLIPSRTDTAWWHDFIMKADEIRFIRGRLKFGGAKQGAPFPSAIVVFRGRRP